MALPHNPFITVHLIVYKPMVQRTLYAMGFAIPIFPFGWKRDLQAALLLRFYAFEIKHHLLPRESLSL